MFYDSENSCFYVDCELKLKNYQFKFDAYCDWTLSYGSGEENLNGKSVSSGVNVQTSSTKGENTNFLFTPSSSGTDRFTFYEDDKTFMITQK